MVLAETILYFFILALFFFFKIYKRSYGCDKRIIRHRYDTLDKRVASKPLWLVKAHYGFLIFIFIFTFIALSVLLTVLWSIFRNTFIFTDPNTIYIGSSWSITFLPIVLIALPISNLIVENLPFKTARYAASSHYNVPTLPHRLDIKITLWIFIFFFAIGFPFVIMNTDYYSYVKDDTICVNEFFSFSENVYKIPAQIESAEVTYKKIDYNDYDFKYTIYFTDGKRIEILDENRFESEKVIQIDDILVNKNVPVNRASMSLAEWNDIEDTYIQSLTAPLKNLYIIGN